MEETTQVVEETTPAEDTAPTVLPTEEVEVTDTPPVDPFEANNKQLFERAKKAEAEAKAAKARAEAAEKTSTKSLDVVDYIDISAALEGLDQREKEYLAEQHKLTGRPLSEIRNDENFAFWQTAYRQKVEKEKSLKPSGAQPDYEKPKNLADRLGELRGSQDPNSMKEKEELLKKAGLYREPTRRPDTVLIGSQS